MHAHNACWLLHLSDEGAINFWEKIALHLHSPNWNCCFHFHLLRDATSRFAEPCHQITSTRIICIYMTKNPNKASFSCSFIPRVSTTTASSAYLSFTLSVLSRKSKQKVKLFANTVLHWFTSYTSSQHFWNLVCQSKYMILHEGSLNMKSWTQQAPPQTSPLYIE